MHTRHTIQLQNCTKRYYQKQHFLPVVDNFSHTFMQWTWTGVRWPNGVGKTTLLQLIMKLKNPDEGKVVYTPQTRCSYVFQNYSDALFPRMTVEQNITYPLLINTYNKKERTTTLEVLLKQCPFNIPLDSYPYMLSGGQQQLVNILRAVITQPHFLLLDESFSSLDYLVKQALYTFVQELFLSHKMGIIMVSHDLDELLLLADNVLSMKKESSDKIRHIPIAVPYPRTRTRPSTSEFFRLKESLLETHLFSL